ncbi:MAG: uncharacterized protein A8A55_1648 [Amphiamblys sp. WSBS2006]|nr:MAG: uncharacterized protein A8A55_1648 [Amphiamblys sp. WSBS2006]
MKRLELENHAVEILPKLKLHEENVIEELVLCADNTRYITEIPKMDNNSLWIGKVKVLKLGNYTIGILPKLRIHEENVMEKFVLDAYWAECIVEILEMENKSLRVGRVRKIKLTRHAKDIKSKLDFTEIAPDGQEVIGSG